MSTISSAGWPARSSARRTSAIREVTPVEVSLWTTQTALIAWPRSSASAASTARGIDAVAPVARQQLDLEPEAPRHLVPQAREMAGLGHQHAVARRERVDQRRLPRPGARGRIDHDRPCGLEDRPDRRPGSRRRGARNPGPRWSIVGRSIARRIRSGTLVGPGICRKWRPLRWPSVMPALPGSMRARALCWHYAWRPARHKASPGLENLRSSNHLVRKTAWRGLLRRSDLGSARGVPPLAQRLARAIEGEVLFDAFDRARYSTDASIYQIEPLGVVLPRSDADVQATLAIAREEGVPVIARGGGTSQAGQTIGDGLVIDYSKHLDRVLELDPAARTVWVEPGVVLDRLNRFLKPHGLFFPVDISTSSRATLGGMAANNACGARSLRYGIMVDNLLAIDALLADGEPVQLRRGAGQPAGRRRQPALPAADPGHARARRARGRRDRRGLPQGPAPGRRLQPRPRAPGRPQHGLAAGRLGGHARAVPPDQARAAAARRRTGCSASAISRASTRRWHRPRRSSSSGRRRSSWSTARSSSSAARSRPTAR